MVVSFISDENVSFCAMFAPGRDVYINDDCAVFCYSVYYIFLINPGLFVKTKSGILVAFPCLRVGSLPC